MGRGSRYAQYESKDGEEPSSDSDIPPLSNDGLKVVLDFILKMAEHELTDARSRRTQTFSIIAVIITGSFAIYTTLLQLTKK